MAKFCGISEAAKKIEKCLKKAIINSGWTIPLEGEPVG